jgi:hypothetical protein
MKNSLAPASVIVNPMECNFIRRPLLRDDEKDIKKRSFGAYAP